jgi:hypothetical protein
MTDPKPHIHTCRVPWCTIGPSANADVCVIHQAYPSSDGESVDMWRQWVARWQRQRRHRRHVVTPQQRDLLVSLNTP